MSWDRVYATYKLEEIPWHSNKAPTSLAVAAKKIGRGVALEVCSGAGTNSLYLARHGFKVKGVDICKTAVAIAKRRARAQGLSIEFRKGNVLDLRGHAQYDFVFDRGCFHHIP